MTKIKVGGRELALDFTIEAMDKMEEALGEPIDLSNLMNVVMQKANDRKALVGMIWAMANPVDGNAEPITLDWMRKHIHPGKLVKLRIAVLTAMTEGMEMETEKHDEEDEVDVVLEEIKKNAKTED